MSATTKKPTKEEMLTHLRKIVQASDLEAARFVSMFDLSYESYHATVSREIAMAKAALNLYDGP